MSPELPITGNTLESLFEEEHGPNEQASEEAYRLKTRKTEQVQRTIVQQVLLTTKAEVDKQPELSAKERAERYEEALTDALEDIDRSAADSLQHDDEADTERIRKQFLSEIVKGETRLEIMDIVARAEASSEENAPTAREQAIQTIAERLSLGVPDATVVYDHYSQHPETHLQVIEIERAKAVLLHAPDEFENFVELVADGDTVAVEQLLSQIASNNDEFAQKIQRLGQSRQLVMARRELVTQSDVRIEATLGEQFAIEELSPVQRVALAEALESIDQPVLSAWQGLDFEVRPDGLHANWLGSDLRAVLTPDGYAGWLIDDVPVAAGIGQKFFEAAVIGRIARKTSVNLPVHAWRKLATIVGTTGPGFGAPTSDQVRVAVRTLRRLRVDKPENRKRYDVEHSGKIDQEMCDLLSRQVNRILDDAGVQSSWLTPNGIGLIGSYWQQQRAHGQRPGVLSMPELTQLVVL